MPSLNENLSTVRLLLDRPDPQQPGDAILFTLLTQQVQHHLNQLQNSSSHWSVYNWPIITAPGEDEYLVTAQNFGKPFLVETVLDPSADTPYSFSRREIPFVLLQNRTQFYRGPQQIGVTSVHTAVMVTFYRSSDAGWYLRFTPTPSETKEYRVWYETAASPVPSLGADIGLSPFQHLICVQTALAAIPHCSWGEVRADADGPKALAWERKTKAIALARSREEAQFQKEFSTYIGTLMQAGIEPRDGFGDEGFGYWW